MTTEQQWKPVVGYEGYYEVSNDGVIKSLSRTITVIDGDRTYQKQIHSKVLNQSNHSAGYKVVRLVKDGKDTLWYVHRLVAEAFIPNPKNYKCVNHKDEDKKNNTVYNLEWCDHAYNNNYGTARERANMKLTGISKVFTDDELKYIRDNYISRDTEFGGCALARKFGVNIKTIYSVLNGRYTRGRK